MGRDSEDNDGSKLDDPISTTVETYDTIAKEFRRYTLREGDRGYQEEILKSTLGSLQRSPTILDAGCGDGRDTNFLKEEGADVTGLDLSMNMLKLAQKCHPDCDFILGDMRYTPFFDDTFDCVWASASIIHFPKKGLHHVQKELCRIIKKNGLLVFSFKKGDGEGYENEPYGSPRYLSYYTIQELREYLTSFDIVKCIEYPGTILNSEFVYCWAIPRDQKNPLKGPR